MTTQKFDKHEIWRESLTVKPLFITNVNLKQEIRQWTLLGDGKSDAMRLRLKDHTIIKCRKFKILHKQLHNKKY